jgi:hypothetical protein
MGATPEQLALIRIDPITGDRSIVTEFTEVGIFSIAVVPSPVPEPSTLALAGIGAIALFARGVRRRSQSSN